MTKRTRLETTPRRANSRSTATPVGIMALAVACGVAFADPSMAQIETRSKAPIDITADQAEVVNGKCMAVWSGSAEAIQDKTRLRADSITIYSRSKGTGSDGQPACGNAERIVAEGHVFYATNDQNAKGDRAVYTQADDQIVVTGDVVLVQGQDVARGDKLIIHVQDHQATLVSKVTGAGKPGRVRAVFYPDKSSPAAKPDGAAAPAPSSKP